jgi:hypothetical protein
LVQSQLRETVCETLSQKHSRQKRAGGVAQVVEHFHSKHEALSSNPSMVKKIKKLASVQEGKDVSTHTNKHNIAYKQKQGQESHNISTDAQKLLTKSNMPS